MARAMAAPSSLPARNRSFRTFSLGFLVAAVAVGAACGGSNQAGLKEEPKPAEPDGGEFDAGQVDGFGESLGDPDASGPRIGDKDPETCAQAAEARSYVGCDFWPTVVPNLVKDIFDFAVVVSNVGKTKADIEVNGPGITAIHEAVEPGEVKKIFLPWVNDLKKGEGVAASTIARGGAYHVTTSVPVIVYQFNALEFQGKGGPPGKSWDNCVTPQEQMLGMKCFSYSNDASLLLPSTAMTGNYRIMGQRGWTRSPSLFNPAGAKDATYIAVTATADATDVSLKLASSATVVAGGGIQAGAPGDTLNFSLAKGDVALVATSQGDTFDLSGSLLTATKAVQVIAGVPCIDAPKDVQACDHVEETVFPAETLGKHYVVSVPTGPKNPVVGHLVRLYGNHDGTKLTYAGDRPAGCPTTLDAGDVADCGVVTTNFEVTGDHEFGVGSFMLGGERLDPSALSDPQGDPSMSLSVAVEQYRRSYLFLAPDDYTSAFVDIVAPSFTTIMLDGQPLSASFSPVGTGSDFGVGRIPLTPGAKGGAHTLTADKPIGIQVMGYGANTSFQYPGGLNLGQIADAPVR